MRRLACLLFLTICALDCRLPAQHLPPAGVQGQPLEVAVGVYLIDVSGIDDVERTCTMDLVIDLQWRDPGLADSIRDSERRLAPDQAWHPELQFVNERGVRPRLTPVLRVAPDGTVRLSQRYSGVFSTPLDLSEFPFDSHTLAIEIAIVRTRPEDVVCVSNPDLTGREAGLGLAGWHLKGLRARPGIKRLAVAATEFPAVFVEVQVERESGFYMWKIVFPLTLIVFMASAVFFFPPTLAPTQIAISTTSVLTMIAFHLSVGSYLPRISYLTRLDLFVVGCTALVFATFGQAVCTGHLAHTERAELARRIDRWSRPVFFATFAALAGLTLL